MGVDSDRYRSVQHAGNLDVGRCSCMESRALEVVPDLGLILAVRNLVRSPSWHAPDKRIDVLAR